MSDESAPRETPRERLSYAAYRSVEKAAMALPEAWGRRLFDLGGQLGYHVALRARRVVAENLSRVLGKDPRSPLVQAAVQEAFRSYARYWFEAFRVRVLSDREFLARYRVEGGEHLEAAEEAGRGAVLALPHIGNYDAAGRWVHASGHRITAVAELLKPDRLFELFLQHRRELGMNIVPLYNSRTVGEELMKLLSQNHFIALVSERDLKGKGLKVEMFGEERRMPAGPAMLSLAAGVPLLPCACYDLEDGWRIVIRPPLEIERSGDMREDVKALTRKLASVFERDIAAAPTQWHMFQPAWPKEEDEPERSPEASTARA
jgi:phosphatidylinositol dimannoside acyltransferase